MDELEIPYLEDGEMGGLDENRVRALIQDGIKGYRSPLQTGAGNQIFRSSNQGIQLGNSTFALAPFHVDMDGNVFATNVTLTGTITASGSNIVGLMQVGANTLVAPATTISSSWTVTRKDFLIVCRTTGFSGSDNVAIQFNSDSGNNYGVSRFTNFGSQSTANQQSKILLTGTGSSEDRTFWIWVNNSQTLAKYGHWNATQQNASGADFNPGIDWEGSFSWKNTSDYIASVTVSTDGGAVTFGPGTTLTVYGLA